MRLLTLKFPTFIIVAGRYFPRLYRGIFITIICALLTIGLTACFGPPTAKTSDQDFLNFAHQKVTYGDKEISFVENGKLDGFPIIFVHGTPGSAQTWADVLGQVPDEFRYISFDRLGFGEEGNDIAETSLAQHAESLLAIAEQVTDKKPILVGHSYGGPVVVQAALDYPDRFSGIVVAAGALDPALEEIHILQHVGNLWPISHLLPATIGNANQELMALKDELNKLKPRLNNLSVPVAIVHGEVDELVPVENVSFMKTHFPQQTIVKTDLIEGQNHFLPWNSIAALQEAINAIHNTTGVN
ncbi:MAG: alpha/beta hydrolase [Alphaproteobacteria bacterium]|nr:alpha/beta hydrolase [Alphaproteobacteria bacterium]